MKLVGIGLPKTGTTTLSECFRILGFGPHASWTQEVASSYDNGEIEKLMVYADSFESFEDYPWCMLYREFDSRYPGSKFIYTVRKDVETWLESRRIHSFVKDHEFYSRNDKAFIVELTGLYVRHDKAVRDYFKSRPNDLIEICWERGDGWEKLAPFLGRPTPEIGIPHLNQSSSSALRSIDDTRRI
jgi:hypothetical protein